jgi:hypothetical protein
MNKLKQTRVFEFPNAGHSTRKLTQELRELGDTPVVPNTSYNYGLEFSYIEDQVLGTPAILVAQVLATLGDRFTVNGEGHLSFYRKSEADHSANLEANRPLLLL